jgi:hypothetical protein
VPSERCSVPSDVVRGHSQYYIDCSTTEHLSEGTLGKRPEDGNVIPKHVGATIHN